MFNKILAAFASIALAASPVNARIEEGTVPLLNLIDSNGIPVSYNTSECDDGEYLGVYIHRGLQRKMVLCPGATVTDVDHAVVRHEAWHAVQHCVNTARGTSVFTPVNTQTNELMAAADEVLGEVKIREIFRLYPQDHWLLEIEAFIAMEIFTADEIAEMFTKACTL